MKTSLLPSLPRSATTMGVRPRGPSGTAGGGAGHAPRTAKPATRHARDHTLLRDGLVDILKIDPGNEVALDALVNIYAKELRNTRRFRSWVEEHIEANKANIIAQRQRIKPRRSSERLRSRYTLRRCIRSGCWTARSSFSSRL